MGLFPFSNYLIQKEPGYMSVIELEIDRILRESLSEGYPMYAKDWEYYGSKNRKPASDSGESEEEEEGDEEEAAEEEPAEDEEEPRPERKDDCEEHFAQLVNDEGYTEDVALSWMQLKPGCEGYEPQGEPSEEEDIDCDALLNDPELKDLLDKIKRAGTLKSETADMLRNVSLTVDMLAFALAGAAVGGTAIIPGANLGGAAFAAAVLKGAGVVTGSTLLAASLLGVLNGDYKAAAIDGTTGLISLAFTAGGGGVSKAAVKGVASAAGKQATKNIAKRLGAGIAGAAAKVETKVAAALVSKGMAQETATIVAKSIVQQSLNAGSSKLRTLLGGAPEQGDMSDEDYKEALIEWQNKQSEKITKIYDRCFKRAPESEFKKKVRGFVRGINKFASVAGRWIGKAIGAVKGLYNKIMGEGTLNESQIKVLKELGLNDMILLKEEKLVTIHINFAELRKQELNESFLAMFGGWVESILKSMFGKTNLQLAVTGTDREVRSFANAISGEKSYMDAVRRYGLDHPTTYKNKAKLDNSIKGFERETGLKWPFK